MLGQVKRCIACGVEKPRTDFHRRAVAYDGLSPQCKRCKNANNRAYVAEHREHLLEKKRAFYARPEKRAARNAAAARYRTENPEKSAAACERWRKSPAGRARVAAWFRDYGKHDEAVRRKVDARVRVKLALKTGQLHKPDACESCHTRGKVEAHHIDYSRPLEVTWLCRRCHSALHHGNGQSAPTAFQTAS